MNLQGDALSAIGERVDELYLLTQQAQSRLEKSQQQQMSFRKIRTQNQAHGDSH